MELSHRVLPPSGYLLYVSGPRPRRHEATKCGVKRPWRWVLLGAAAVPTALFVAGCAERTTDPLTARFADVRVSRTVDHRPCAPQADGPCQVAWRDPIADDTYLTELPADADARLLELALRDLQWARQDSIALPRARAALERLVAGRKASSGDLAAAYVLESDRTGSALPLLRAIDLLDRDDDRSPLTLFNRAVALERLALDGEAVQAWRAYRRVDSASAWGDEARARLRAIEARWRARATRRAALVDTGPIDPRVMVAEAAEDRDAVWRALLRRAAAWGRAGLRGDTVSAERNRVQAVAIARALDPGASARDAFQPDAPRDDACEYCLAFAPSPNDRVLWRAHVDLADGLDAFNAANTELAVTRLAAAEAGFRRAASRFEVWARFHHAAALADLGEFAAAEPLFDALSRHPEARVRARALTSRGVTAVRQGLYAVSIERYTEALHVLDGDGAPPERAFLQSLLAESRALLGDHEGAAIDGLAAQRVLARQRESGVLPGHLTALAELARADGLPIAAARVSREAVSLAVAGAGGIDQAWASAALARNLDAAGRQDAARAALDTALEVLATVPDGRVRDHVHSLILMDNASLIASDPRHDPAWLARAAQTLRRFRNGISLPLALQLTAEQQLAAGDSSAARETLIRAVRTLQAQATQMGTGSDRWRFDEAREATFDALMRLEVRSGTPTHAFRWLELLRGGRDAPSIQWASRIRRALPVGTAVVCYLVLDDRVVVWVLSRERERVAQVAVTRRQLAGHVAAAVSGRRELPAFRALDSVLMAPVADALRGARRLLVVPDRELGSVPFAALWDGTRYLVEQWTPLMNASLTMVARSLEAPPAVRVPQRVLAVASGGGSGSGFAPLPRAGAEAAAVARLYPDAEILESTRATVSQVMTSIRTAEVLHFAGHAASNLEFPERSFLQMATPRSASDGLTRQWTVGAIATIQAPQLGLAFLSACRTFGMRATHRIGAGSLAEAFQRAGVTRVVSTLFEVTDADAEAVATEFHRQLLVRGDAAGALRASQLQALRSGRDVAWWAFVYSGT